MLPPYSLTAKGLAALRLLGVAFRVAFAEHIRRVFEGARRPLGVLRLEVQRMDIAKNPDPDGTDILQAVFMITPKAIGEDTDGPIVGDIELSDEEKALFSQLEEGLEEVDSADAPDAAHEAAKEQLGDWLKDKKFE